MISSKKVYSTYFKEYVLDGKTLEQLHRELLQILVDIKEYCDEQNIDYMVGGGTLLGTVRHKGFIPWDDDIDIMMTRENYIKFSKGFSEYFSDKYLLVEPLSPGYYCKMPKIYKKNTTYIEISNAGLDSYNMLFVDVFILENVPSPGIKRTIRAKIYDIAYKGASVCVDYLYPSPVIENKAVANKEVAEYYKFRRKLGKLFTIFGGIKFYLKICEKLAKYNHSTNWIGCPSGISYEREILPSHVYQEIEEGEFCGVKVKIPKQYDIYLKNLYGNDYMQIPPLEKREYHVAYKIEF